MNGTNDLDFLMISAGFEHGGNVTLRLLDGHDELFVYPFESQIGNKHTTDFLSSMERTQYRYPEFPAGLSARELYELFYDEELKTLLRKPNGSKFKTANIEMKESDRIDAFCKYLENKPYTRANIVAAFFVSTFSAWKNYKVSGKNHMYVGYSPIIGIDAHKILADFPKAHVVHVVRNPLSAYADTKKRPFPLPFHQYVMSWNLYHHAALVQQSLNPQRMTIVRYEDIVGNTRKTMEMICSRVGIAYSDSMLHPSFNSKDITGNIFPWGTINNATKEENKATAASLSSEEMKNIIKYSGLMIKHFGYEDFIHDVANQKIEIAQYA
ncbi:hypothetical protein BN59_00492 [Legionella massiliensis]|uniref:Sulfotransferase domain protein n=1 Tax=Legionella massiliensis TaxID=1034943 RepID=A0A078KPA3_9GAMM|nr:sulfotransferase [Legionella massiliensis]CDZ76225.1 hypothetical protein BN59_00492 [Legionella massiliensis]CEE11963.1 hypothetical protein BN1094_00492 [Legionella massiliensis]